MTPGFDVMVGDCRVWLRALADAGFKARMCVTSPPYFRLRDYRHDGQLGMEETPEQYIAAMVEVFRAVRDVLADDGTCWINIGDSYGKDKSLVGIPWMLAFALRADGWYLRQEIIWHKPNPMPESVRDRCTKAHEQVFLLSKSPRYYYDADAVKEPAAYADSGRPSKVRGDFAGKNTEPGKEGFRAITETRNKRSVWTVAPKPYAGAHFAVYPPELIEPCILAGSQPAGKRCDCDAIIRTPTGTVQAPDPSREVGRAGMSRPRGDQEGSRPITKREQRHHALEMKSSPHRDAMAARCGPAFAHYVRTDDSGARPLPEAIRQEFMGYGWITEAPACECPIHPGDVVIDPFGGSGTTAGVAVLHGRSALMFELNPEYAALMPERVASIVKRGAK